jgi:predicted transcriptional regulator YdeE
MGVVAHGSPEEIDFEAIWRDGFMPHHARIQSLSTDGAYYGVAIETGKADVIDYLAGMAVDDSADVPDGLVAHDIRATHDAVFECTVATISQAWDSIFKQWLPASGYVYDAPCECYEQYPPDTSDEDSPVLIHVPVRKAGCS